MRVAGDPRGVDSGEREHVSVNSRIIPIMMFFDCVRGDEETPFPETIRRPVESVSNASQDFL
jgi:hypothetical protein